MILLFSTSPKCHCDLLTLNFYSTSSVMRTKLMPLARLWRRGSVSQHETCSRCTDVSYWYCSCCAFCALIIHRLSRRSTSFAKRKLKINHFTIAIRSLKYINISHELARRSWQSPSWSDAAVAEANGNYECGVTLIDGGSLDGFISPGYIDRPAEAWRHS